MAAKFWLGLALALGPVAASAQALDPVIESLSREPPGYSTGRLSKATLGSAEIMLVTHTSIRPDCSPAEPLRPVTVLQPPAHGAVRIAKEMVFARYPADNPRAACARRRVPGDTAYYAAEPGYRGHDLVVLQLATTDGHVRDVTVEIDVR